MTLEQWLAEAQELVTQHDASRTRLGIALKMIEAILDVTRFRSDETGALHRTMQTILDTEEMKD